MHLSCACRNEVQELLQPRRTVPLVALGPQETLFPFLALPQTPGLLEGKSYKVNLSRAQFSLVTKVEWIFESVQQHLMSVVC